MNRISFLNFVILLVSCLTANAQKVDTVIKENYKIDKKLVLQKPLKQRESPWLLLGTGLVSTGLGAMKVNPNNGSNLRNSQFIMSGLSAVGGSIPLFISAAKNKK